MKTTILASILALLVHPSAAGAAPTGVRSGVKDASAQQELARQIAYAKLVRSALDAEVATLGSKIQALREEIAALSTQLKALSARIPNPFAAMLIAQIKAQLAVAKKRLVTLCALQTEAESLQILNAEVEKEMYSAMADDAVGAVDVAKAHFQMALTLLAAYQAKQEQVAGSLSM